MLLTILIFINMWAQIQSAKILAVFPTPSISHQVVFRPLTQELARRGHEVTVITPDPAFPKGDTPENLEEIDVHDISYQSWQKFFQEVYKADQSDMNFSEIKQGLMLMAYIVEIQLQSPQVQKLLSDETKKFDLIFVEAIMRIALGYSYIFKAPVILVSSLGALFDNHHVMGSPTHPFLFPSALHKKTYNLTLYEKVNLLYTHYTFEYAHYLNTADENKLLQKTFGPDIPPLSDLYSNINMLFINIHPIWADNQPVPPSVVYIGGIQQIVQKELPQDLKTYLDSSKHGVIYLSFGSNLLAEMIPPHIVQIIVKVLSSLPYNILWKWDKDELLGRSKNIRLSKWFPQSDLLRHPKLKLFITQAGLQSTDEAIAAGVPLLAVPMLGDQWYNAEKYVKHGIGEMLNLETLAEDQFRNTVLSVINNESYRKNIIKLREIMRDQPEPPLQRAIWWTEYVIRHGGAKHLRPPTANITYSQYFEMELMFITLLTIFVVLALIMVALVLITRKIRNFLKYKMKVKIN